MRIKLVKIIYHLINTWTCQRTGLALCLGQPAPVGKALSHLRCVLSGRHRRTTLFRTIHSVHYLIRPVKHKLLRLEDLLAPIKPYAETRWPRLRNSSEARAAQTGMKKKRKEVSMVGLVLALVTARKMNMESWKRKTRCMVAITFSLHFL